MIDAANRQFSLILLKNMGKYQKKTRQEIKRDIEDLIPEILVSQASITGEVDNTNPNLLTSRPPRTDALIIKLNRLHQKPARCNSYKDFLSRCVQEKLVPKGLKQSFEKTIGNYDQEFIDN